jgi:DNA-binding MarR family transcriptional regulator
MITPLLDDLETRLAVGLRADAARAGLREATARLLLAVEREEVVAMSALARRMGRDASTATRFVDRAVAQGLLQRDPGARDRRRRLVRLTEAGGEARARLVAIRQDRAGSVLDAIRAGTGLGEGQVEWFLSALLAGTR